MNPINGGNPAIENKDNITVTEKNCNPENLLNSFKVKKFFISNTSKIENNKNSKYIYINIFKYIKLTPYSEKLKSDVIINI